MSKKQKKNKPKINNLVAKHARDFNVAVTMRDRKNDYSRKQKHKNKGTDQCLYSFLTSEKYYSKLAS